MTQLGLFRQVAENGNVTVAIKGTDDAGNVRQVLSYDPIYLKEVLQWMKVMEPSLFE